MRGLPRESENEELLDAVLGTYLRAGDQDQTLNRTELLARYPQFQHQLVEFFADFDRVESLTAPLREVAGAAQALTSVAGDAVTAAGVSSDPSPGQSFGDYDLLEEVGRGGMGVVYRARQRSLNRIVALKLVRADRPASAAEIQRFRNEAEAAAHLDHPNIVPIYEVGACEGQHYFSMKFAEGGSLARQNGCFAADPRSAAVVLVSLARAVHHAHQRGVLHRDLKPVNVLLSFSRDAESSERSADAPAQPRQLPYLCAPALRSEDSASRLNDFVPMIGDFGLAKRLEQESALTQTGMVIGTPSYLAPEQASGSSGGVTTATDVYGLGAILYELLTGRAPFRGGNVLDTLALVRSSPPGPPRRLNRHVPRDLETICLKCLEKEPLRRYASAADLADDLGRFLDGRPITAQTARWPERLVKWVRRQPVLAMLLLVSVLAVGAFAGGLAYHTVELGQALEQVQQRERQVRLREWEVRDREYVSDLKLSHESLWKNGDVERMREILSRHVPGPGEEDRRGFAWYYLDRLARGEGIATLNAHAGGVFAIAYSPDGRWLASSGKDGKVRIWDTGTWKEHRTLDGDLGAMKTLSFSADGRWLASSGTGRRILVWATHNWRARSVPEHEAEAVRGVAFSPDRPELVSWSDNIVRVWDPETGKGWGGRPVSGAMAFAVSTGGKVHLRHGHYLTVWDWQTDKAVEERNDLDAPTNAIACVPFGERVALGGPWPGHLHLYKPFSEALITLIGHKGSVHALAVSPSGFFLASAGKRGIVHLWNSISGNALASYKGHSGAVDALAYAPDGKFLASASADGTVRIWDTMSTRVSFWNTLSNQDHDTLRSLSETSGQLAITEEGLIAVVCHDWTVRLLDPKTWQEQAVLRGHRDGVVSAAVGGQWIATACSDAKLRLFDAKTGRVQRTLSWWPQLPATLSPDGRYVAGGFPAEMVLWDLMSDHQRKLTHGHVGLIRDMAFSPDSKSLVTVGNEAAKVWDLASGKACVYKGFRGNIDAAAFSPDGRFLAVGGEEGAVVLWELAHPDRPPQRIYPHESIRSITRLAFSRDGRLLAAGGERDIALFDFQRRRTERRLSRGHAGQVVGLAFSPDGRFLVSGDAVGGIKRWDLENDRITLPPGSSLGPVNDLTFSADSESLYTFSGDVRAVVTRIFTSPLHSLLKLKPTIIPTIAEGNTAASIRIWDVSPGGRMDEPKARLSAPALESASRMALSRDGNELVMGCYGGAIARWSLPGEKERPLLFTDKGARTYYESCRTAQQIGAPIFPKFIHAAEVKALALSHDSTTLAVVDRASRVRIWNHETGEEGKLLLDGQSGQTDCLAFSPASGLLALNRGLRIELWDVVTGQRRQKLGEHPEGTQCLAFSPDGSLLASGGGDWRIWLWDVREGRLKGTLSGHTGVVSSVAFAPDGQTLASGSLDRTVRLWHVPTMQEMYSLEGHRSIVTAVAFSPDGHLLASGGTRGLSIGEVYLWRAKP